MLVDTPSPPRPHVRRRLVPVVLLGAGFLLSVDFSVLNVALPQAGADVGLDPARWSWITSAFALPAAGCTLLFGRLGDLYGRRRLFAAGMLLLAVASLLGGAATTPAVLLGARALQGLATAMTIPAAMALLTTTFTESAARDRVLGLNGALQSGGFAVGALAGGLLVSGLGWRAAFLVNVPVALLVLALIPFVLRESTGARRTRLDWPGAVTVTAGLVALVHGAVEHQAVTAVAGVLLLGAFWLIESRAANPLAPVRILTRPTVAWGNAAGLVVLATGSATIFLMTLYLQQVLGLSPLATGLVFGLPGLAAVLAGVLAGRLVGRFGSRAVLTAGMAVQGLAALPLLATGTDRGALAFVVPTLFVMFLGHVSGIVAYVVAGTSGLPDHEQGLATGLTSMTQQIGIAVGIPFLGAVAATRAIPLEGIHLGIGIGALAALSAAVLVRLRLRPANT